MQELRVHLDYSEKTMNSGSICMSQREDKQEARGLARCLRLLFLGWTLGRTTRTSTRACTRTRGGRCPRYLVYFVRLLDLFDHPFLLE